MRDPLEFNTKRGTPWLVIVSRLAFTIYFIFAAYVVLYPHLFPESRQNWVWILYLMAIYCLAETFYWRFRERMIDMTFAFPLLFAVYLLNLGSILIDGQERLPIMNRLEHFASFILVAYVISVFFYQYLPHEVWREHPYYTALLVMSVTALFGVANEIIELFFDTFFGTHHVGSQYDTSLDLLMNTLGSGLLLSMRLLLRSEKPTKKKR